ncbi:Flagellar basal body rod protein [Sodalis praecaptivus]|uniref:Flagellar basal-body rod protein FlgF n=1 Tax=Sodalis praecaptivus TaxID=1239307 RepID=W0HT79_9GAMM|nr:flagellar basal body rod protein FlgF [Sodalis praecaptivus]AHF75732.1 Flagellar basal body rod protein [Sodalis praecaptivus]
MDHAIYTAMGAAAASLDQQAVIANNLANASTTGFRAQLSAARAVPVEGESLPTRTLSVASTPGALMTPGPIETTGRSLDVALGGDGFLAVQLPDGQEAYTRNGNIQQDADGQLTVQGYPLMGQNGPLVVPTQASLTIGDDGTVSALGDGDALNTVGPVGQLKRVTAEAGTLVRGDDGLFHLNDDAQGAQAPLPNDNAVSVMSGMLEGSNVNTAETLVDMIGTARRFEMQMKVIASVDQNAQQANQLLSLS